MYWNLIFVLPALVGAQLGEIISYQVQRFSECQDYIATCPPTISGCAAGLCAQCYNFGGAGFKSCCNQTPPYLCFQTAEGGAAGAGGSSNAGLVTTTADPNLVACSSAVNVLSACEASISGFTDLDGTVQASCLCYASSSWVPTSFDNAWSGCVAYASTADVTDYPVLMSAEGLCQSAGNVRSAAAAAGPAAPSTTSSGSAGSATQRATATAGTATSTTAASSTSSAAASSNAASTTVKSSAGPKVQGYRALMVGAGLMAVLLETRGLW